MCGEWCLPAVLVLLQHCASVGQHYGIGMLRDASGCRIFTGALFLGVAMTPIARVFCLFAYIYADHTDATPGYCVQAISRQQAAFTDSGPLSTCCVHPARVQTETRWLEGMLSVLFLALASCAGVDMRVRGRGWAVDTAVHCRVLGTGKGISRNTCVCWD